MNVTCSAWAQESPSQRVLVDLHAAMLTDDAHADLWAPDGLHFSEAGYQLFAEQVVHAMLKAPAFIAHGWLRETTSDV